MVGPGREESYLISCLKRRRFSFTLRSSLQICWQINPRFKFEITRQYARRCLFSFRAQKMPTPVYLFATNLFILLFFKIKKYKNYYKKNKCKFKY